jgi:hypothetical protein
LRPAKIQKERFLGLLLALVAIVGVVLGVLLETGEDVCDALLPLDHTGVIVGLGCGVLARDALLVQLLFRV